MSHLFFPGKEPPCPVFRLDHLVYDLDAFPPATVAESLTPEVRDQAARSRRVLLVPTSGARQAGWAILVGPGRAVWINGQRIDLGLCVLDDRDHIRIGQREGFFFSAEKPNETVSFPGSDHEVICPRCKAPIEAGEEAVCCPGCGVWHHQSETRPCWIYDKTCGYCHKQPTELDAGLQWVPQRV